jgi:hypothetical protein
MLGVRLILVDLPRDAVSLGLAESRARKPKVEA